MPLQDRTGNSYEQLLAASLRQLGYIYERNTGLNYLHPKQNRQIVIANTFIQPDLVIRHDEIVKAIFYVTHWSSVKNSNLKFWRTWEELAQQKLIVGNDVLSINCVFEGLPQDFKPAIYITSDDIPFDENRTKKVPMSFSGWYSATSWAFAESYDVTLVFPIGYKAVKDVENFDEGDHSITVTDLVAHALAEIPKTYYSSQWTTLRAIRQDALDTIPSIQAINSRYRISLLHIYMIYRIFNRLIGQQVLTIDALVTTLIAITQNKEEFTLAELLRKQGFQHFAFADVKYVFEILAQIYVSAGRNPTMLCTVQSISDEGNSVVRIKFNDDLCAGLQDLGQHIAQPYFFDNLQQVFNNFDGTYGIDDVVDDLAHPQLVSLKEAFVRQHFAHLLQDEQHLNQALQIHAKNHSHERLQVSAHQHNWVFEMVLYLSGLNSFEDIQKTFKPIFEASGHMVRPHAPYSDFAKILGFLQQGRDICEHWATASTQRTLTEDEFYTLSWESVAKCIVRVFAERNCPLQNTDNVIKAYQQAKAKRIIGSDLNSFEIMVWHNLGDLCVFAVSDDDLKAQYNHISKNRILRSWQTSVINKIWRGRPLETWVEGVSLNGKWLIKLQSSQDGNEGHKTKELAGRSRAFHLRWHHGDDPRNRDEWTFDEHPNLKVALVLDGDWSVNNIRNLYEAGWDWVGGVSDLQALRDLITADADNT